MLGKKGNRLALYSHTGNQAGTLSLPIATVIVNKCNISPVILQLFFTLFDDRLASVIDEPCAMGDWGKLNINP
uniref:Uncharacterized protein n=1 Tax=Tolypothrix bouteillei VB521301 TaxID=1479485 RepID=A0A0C1RMR0_9CYAN